MVLFFMPLAMYKLPMPVQLYDRTVLVEGRIVLTAALVCAAWFAVAIGIILWPGTPAARPRPWAPGVLSGAFVGFSLAGSAVSLATSICLVPGAVAEVFHWISFAPVAAAVLGVYLLREPGRSGVVRGLIWVLILLDLAVKILMPIGLAEVTPAAVAVIAILYGLNAMGLPARRWLAAATVLGLVVAVAIPLKEFLRTAFYNGDAFRARACLLAGRPPAVGDLSVAAQKYRRIIRVSSPDTFGLRWTPLGGAGGVLEFGAARAVNRLNRLGDFAYVVATPLSRVPFARGATYRPILGVLVPRAVWPGKPLNDGAGQFYGHRYGFLAPSDTSHSDNLPVIIEGWMNAGWPGALASAAAVGILLRLIWYWWLGDSGAPGNVVIGMAVVSAAVDQDSNLGLLTGGVIHGLIVYAALDFLMRAVNRRNVRRLRTERHGEPCPTARSNGRQ